MMKKQMEKIKQIIIAMELEQMGREKQGYAKGFARGMLKDMQIEVDSQKVDKEFLEKIKRGEYTICY